LQSTERPRSHARPPRQLEGQERALLTQVVKQLQQMLAESRARVRCRETENCTKEAEHTQQLSARKLWAETQKAMDEEHARTVEGGAERKAAVSHTCAVGVRCEVVMSNEQQPRLAGEMTQAAKGLAACDKALVRGAATDATTVERVRDSEGQHDVAQHGSAWLGEELAKASLQVDSLEVEVEDACKADNQKIATTTELRDAKNRCLNFQTDIKEQQHKLVGKKAQRGEVAKCGWSHL
jgi:hypothetical protein